MVKSITIQADDWKTQARSNHNFFVYLITQAKGNFSDASFSLNPVLLFAVWRVFRAGYNLAISCVNKICIQCHFSLQWNIGTIQSLVNCKPRKCKLICKRFSKTAIIILTLVENLLFEIGDSCQD